MRARSILVPLIVSFLAVTVPASALDPLWVRGSAARSRGTQAPRLAGIGPDISPYKHLGAWIDMYNAPPWNNPERATKAMARRGVTTLYLETSNYSKANDLYRPTQMGRFVEAAHANGLKVVAWYVPGFKNMKRDRRRSRAAINFRSQNGEAFDSFAMDIEATQVSDINTRNTRAIRLSRYVRNYVGNNYTLGAIVPEAGALYWPSFPYASLRESYDVFLPMAYYTYRVSGATAVRSFIANNVNVIREATGDPRVPIHVIGGLGGEGTAREARAFADKLIDKRVAGGSFYDYPITTEREWDVLSRLAR